MTVFLVNWTNRKNKICAPKRPHWNPAGFGCAKPHVAWNISSQTDRWQQNPLLPWQYRNVSPIVVRTACVKVSLHSQRTPNTNESALPGWVCRYELFPRYGVYKDRFTILFRKFGRMCSGVRALHHWQRFMELFVQDWTQLF